MTPVALITGGQQGIGLGLAEALAAAGFRIVIAAELAEDAHTVTEAQARLGAGTVYLRHDLRDAGAVGSLIDRVEAAAGPVTTFISNAGIPARTRGDLFDVTGDSFDQVMAINLRGAFFLAQEVGRRMAGRSTAQYRSMTFITSVSAGMVSADRAEYCISKAGASMMAQAFAVRMAPLDIGVFELRPGIIDTAMTAGVRDKYTSRIESGLVPMARWGVPADIGQIIVPIATGQMRFATGAVIPVDGGLSIARL
ncbi:3-ketoacyl-ACP reductase [Tabrizicola sp.]|uniref:3-ketoacyl-ACP reductase n=1 Tax=Tabrizicola sp. TaxID=2005166 RepID=UPI00286A7555|nr:3-ketoacyl-ACP reductase [Tabrizicola sp.]